MLPPTSAPSLPAQLWASRELIGTLVKRDLKIRYKSSALGFLWSFGRPLLLMLVLWVVFGAFTGMRSSHPNLPYSLHLLASILPWMFTGAALGESLGSIIGNSNVIKKIRVPTAAFPASAVLGQLLHFGLAMLVLAGFIAAYALAPRHGAEVLPGWEILLLPLVVALQALLLFAVALLLSSLNVYWRDVGSLTEIGITVWFYLTPIIYPMQLAREQMKLHGLDGVYYVYLLNPMSAITLAYRRVMFGRLYRGAPEVSDMTLLAALGCAAITTGVLLFIATRVFRKLSLRFADEL